MRINFKLALASLAGLAIAAPAAAQTNPIDKLAWLAGTWTADWQGMKVEDTWGPASSGEMLAAFKMLKDGKVQRYDFRSIRMVDGRLTLQELGFKGDMSPDYGPPLSPVSEIDAQHAVFGDFTFASTGPDTMTVTILQDDPKDRTKKTATKVNYTRVRSFSTP